MLGSVLASISLTEALLVFDAIALITYTITLFFGFITGIVQMAQVEVYWTEEYWSYAKKIERDMELAKEELAKQRDASGDDSRGDVLLATACSDDSNGNNQPNILVAGGECIHGMGADTARDTDTVSVHSLVQNDIQIL